ncbi:MAG: hypothetical protein JOY60_02300 [Burkholderiaceae bacterium]|nr:hypothetical protein [Roseateles sp.]MBV8468684.1 hypothetical protein [Burkholderiaceae bacterium]
MNGNVEKLAAKLESLLPRERYLLLAAVPVVLVALAELLWLDPLRNESSRLQKQMAQQGEQMTALAPLLAGRKVYPVDMSSLQSLSQERESLQADVDLAQRIYDEAAMEPAHGRALRAVLASTPGLTLMSLRTRPVEPLGVASLPKAPASGATQGASESHRWIGAALFRHPVEMQLYGPLSELSAFMLQVQRRDPQLRWDTVKLTTVTYPNANLVLTLHVLSLRAESPFY